MTSPVYAIIVSHNSAVVLPNCLAALEQQTTAVAGIIVVDSGSTDRGYLETLRKRERLVLIESENVGFGRANNLGMTAVPAEAEMVIFMNPDTFLLPGFIARITHLLDIHKQAGIVTGKLLGYDPVLGKPSGRLDSTGIFRRWYGRWFDRGQGEPDSGHYDTVARVPAVCGALMCCRAEALMSLGSQEIFDEDFFLYKEDIELSLRMKKKGWQLVYDPSLVAYHCRGWQKDRQRVPYFLRIMAAENEILLYKKHPSPSIIWAIMKYLGVRYLRI